LSLLATALHAITVTIEPSTTECFYETLSKDDHFTLSYDVADGQKIDFHMSNPIGAITKTAAAESYGFETFQAEKEGRYSFCFSNHSSMVTPKLVSFYVYHDGGTRREKPSGGAVDVDPVEKEVTSLTESLQIVRDHQQYMMIRNEQHHSTAKSTNKRVQWWSLFQIGIIIGVTLFQISYLRRVFEVKRVV